ncbi:MAG: T9SS type A sorting domain-containing protein [Bacteroidetes bacterium]|nr:T9SS type A sorting domain-containing protein [Bacteroidota bacterium]
MKKLLLFSSAFISAAALNAQITLTQADVAGWLNVFVNAHDTTHANKPAGAIQPGPAGASQTWTFTTLVADSTDSVLFTSPSWVVGGSNFSSSNLATYNYADSNSSFLTNSSSGITMQGVWTNVNGTWMPLYFNPNYRIAKFPDTYGNTFTNTAQLDLKFYFGQFGIDSIRVKQVIDQNSKTDGWGTLKTPLGNFNSLRHREKQMNTDSVWIYTTGSWFPYSATQDSLWHFEWWANGVGFNLLSMDSAHADTIRNISWLKQLPHAGAVNELSVLGDIKVYPNPAVNQINFEIKNADAAAIEIFDLNGNRIALLPANKNSKITFTAELLAQGTYIYRAFDTNRKVVGTGKFDLIK